VRLEGRARAMATGKEFKRPCSCSSEGIRGKDTGRGRVPGPILNGFLPLGGNNRVDCRDALNAELRQERQRNKCPFPDFNQNVFLQYPNIFVHPLHHYFFH